MKMICFDMDGTIADLYAVPNWLNKLRAEDASPYAEAAPMWDMKALREVLLKLIDKGYEIRIISWLSKDSTEEYKTAVRKAKESGLRSITSPLINATLSPMVELRLTVFAALQTLPQF